MARLTCANPKCRHEWVRKQKASRGQIIRCPSCRITLGIMSTPKIMMSVKEYIGGKAINAYGLVKNKKEDTA